MSSDVANLQLALDWLGELVAGSLGVHFRKTESFVAPELVYKDDDSWLARFIRAQNPAAEEMAILMLTLAPHLDPAFLGRQIAAHLPEGGEFAEFGGVKGNGYRGILPTGET